MTRPIDVASYDFKTSKVKNMEFHDFTYHQDNRKNYRSLYVFKVGKAPGPL